MSVWSACVSLLYSVSPLGGNVDSSKSHLLFFCERGGIERGGWKEKNQKMKDGGGLKQHRHCCSVISVFIIIFLDYCYLTCV